MAKKQNRYKKGAVARDYDIFYDLPIKQKQISPQLVHAHAISDETLRKEYSKLRDIAQKRIKRMEGKPEAAGTYEQHKGGFPKLKGMSRADVVRALGEVSDFLVAKSGSLSGIRKRNEEISEALEEKGIHVPKDQIARFGAFMNAMKRALGVNRGDYASAQIANLWNELFEQGKISQSKFEKRVKELMEDIEEEQKELFTRAQRQNVNTILRDNPISTYFDELALDPRTIRAQEGRADREARSTSRRARQRRTFRRRR